MTFACGTIDSPVGQLRLIASDHGLAAILWENDDPARVRFTEPLEQKEHPILAQTARQLEEYFSGKRKTFSIPLNLRGTRFQRSVWEMLRDIPFGETRTYGELARSMGNARAARAVGAATGRNPISIVVPCHRLVGAAGQLTGFAGGLEAKARLLDLERANALGNSNEQVARRTHQGPLFDHAEKKDDCHWQSGTR
jgi:methylated-DNA-[protein]-cysteine S-methyltransferase